MMQTRIAAVVSTALFRGGLAPMSAQDYELTT
jgi:hypothetical protein